MPIEITPVRALTDNYCYLVHRRGQTDAIVIDPSAAAPIEAELEKRGLTLALILNTHHHPDHVGGNHELVEHFQVPVYCSARDLSRIPRASRGLADGETFDFEGIEITTIGIPGHTQGQIGFYIARAEAVFVGDTLFAMGCGRLTEGNAEQLYSSLTRLTQLPSTTRVYFGHEYTEKNAAFALTVDPKNLFIQERLKQAENLRGKVVPPPRLFEEMSVNPFLHPGSDAIRSQTGLAKSTELEIFAELRRRRDVF